MAPRKRDAAFSANEREPQSVHPPRAKTMEGIFMIEDNVIRLLPAEEEAILACYVTGSKERANALGSRRRPDCRYRDSINYFRIGQKADAASS